MPKYVWMCLIKQDSEYAWGPKYARIMNMAGFSICELYAALWLSQNIPSQNYEYILASQYARILTIIVFWICKYYT